MKIKSFGEFDLIRRISQGTINRKERVVKGIGDDCAVIKSTKIGWYNLFTTDLLVENTHFLRDSISPFDLGYKTLAVNLSDIASMGGIPLDAFISIALTDDVDLNYVEKLYDGIKTLAKNYDVNILGGDTSSSKKNIFINLALTGTVKKKNLLLRSDAAEGDHIYVNKCMGDSAGGLEIILKHKKYSNKNIKKYLLDKHNRPIPSVFEGMWLGSTKKVNSMIDTSDGLLSDLGHILEESRVGAELNIDKIPVSRELRIFTEETKSDLKKLLLTGGEDYALLFTVPASYSLKIENDYFKKFNKGIFKIGVITKKTGIKLFENNRKIKVPLSTGYDHFKR